MAEKTRADRLKNMQMPGKSAGAADADMDMMAEEIDLEELDTEGMDDAEMDEMGEEIMDEEGLTALEDISDDDLKAEMIARGLMADDEEMPEADEEEMLEDEEGDELA